MAGTEERLLPKTGPPTPYTAIAHVVDQYSWCLNDDDDHDVDADDDSDGDANDDQDNDDDDGHDGDGGGLKSKQDYLLDKKSGLIEMDPNLNVLGEQKYKNTAHRWKCQWWLQFGDDDDENCDYKYLLYIYNHNHN